VPQGPTAFGSKPLSATHDLLYYRFQPKAKIGKTTSTDFSLEPFSAIGDIRWAHFVFVDMTYLQLCKLQKLFFNFAMLCLAIYRFRP
jgi:hypothetical protein